MNIREQLSLKIQFAMTAAGIPDDCPTLVTQSKKSGFGDYQANCAMGAAKKMGCKPRELAANIIDHLQCNELAEKIEIAGPGFINIHLKPEWLAAQIKKNTSDPRLGIAQTEAPQTVVIDYSSPNLAKEMHVGHLRSTIIGDVLARLLDFLGHKVIRQNHVGDWGTQFGMLIAELEETLEGNADGAMALKDLEIFYRQSKKHFDSDAEFADKARSYVVKLQSGDSDILKLWQQFTRLSLEHSAEIYEKLNVTLTEADIKGESFYNDDLPVLVQELKDKKLAVEDQGAQVVFLPELADKEGNPSPVIIQKKGGGYLYATTDLAALRYRFNVLGANRIAIFIDTRQSLHLQQVFILARKAGFVDQNIKLEHHAFGTMMGPDGKPFKTRTGGTVKLSDLLDEAIVRAGEVIASKNPDLASDEKQVIAKKVGIGAVKYADLSKTRTNDYTFNWETMLSFEGNTAPYLQYAYARVQSLFRKAEVNPETLTQNILLETPQEKALAIKLLQFSETLEHVAREAYPHLLCTYLYELASLYMSFYEACPILKQGISQELRDSRLLLCHSMAKTLATGLDILGIEVMDRM